MASEEAWGMLLAFPAYALPAVLAHITQEPLVREFTVSHIIRDPPMSLGELLDEEI